MTGSHCFILHNGAKILLEWHSIFLNSAIVYFTIQIEIRFIKKLSQYNWHEPRCSKIMSYFSVNIILVMLLQKDFGPIVYYQMKEAHFDHLRSQKWIKLGQNQFLNWRNKLLFTFKFEFLYLLFQRKKNHILKVTLKSRQSFEIFSD